MPKKKSKSKVKLFNIDKYQKKFFPKDKPKESENFESIYYQVSDNKAVRISSTHFETPNHFVRLAA